MGYLHGRDSTVVFPIPLRVRGGEAERRPGEADLRLGDAGLRLGDADLRGLGLTYVEKSRFDKAESSFLLTKKLSLLFTSGLWGDEDLNGDEDFDLMREADRVCERDCLAVDEL